MGKVEKMMKNKNKEISPRSEMNFLREVLKDSFYSQVYTMLKADFQAIYTHSQGIMGLATICLTITGFSGPRIAASSVFSRFSIAIGLALVILSVFFLLLGPIYPKWMSNRKGLELQRAFSIYFLRRDSRTFKYRLSLVTLVVGLSFYVASVIGYLLSL